jgi:polyisoprenoid-binding protein YceI
MKSIFRLTFGLAIAAALFSFTVLMAPAKQWSVDKAHSAITFSVNHLFTPVEGRFQKFDDEFLFDPENLKESKASFSIDVASVNTQESKRDNHLQSADFFDAKKYPKMKFASTRFESKGDNNYVAYGKLTIKDVTKDVALPFKVLGTADHPMMKGTKVMSLQSELNLNRNDYGVGTGSWAATMVVGDQVNVKITLEATNK